MTDYSLPPVSIVGAEFRENDTNSRPPDAAIRANTEIMNQGMAFFGRLMEASVARSGLDIVVGGSNPGIARPPQKISGLNGQELASLQNLASQIPQSSEDPKPDAKEDPPATPDPNAAPTNKDPVPTPAPAPAPALPADDQKDEAPSTQDKNVITLKEVNIGYGGDNEDDDDFATMD